MAGIAANYFAEMADAFSAIASQMTPRATFALELDGSSLSGISVDTPAHLEAILSELGFRASRDHAPFPVMAR